MMGGYFCGFFCLFWFLGFFLGGFFGVFFFLLESYSETFQSSKPVLTSEITFYRGPSQAVLAHLSPFPELHIPSQGFVRILQHLSPEQ